MSDTELAHLIAKHNLAVDDAIRMLQEAKLQMPMKIEKTELSKAKVTACVVQTKAIHAARRKVYEMHTLLLQERVHGKLD